MATERDFELLDDYLANRMGAEDRAAFEQKLNADPDLRSEYALQQNLVSAIKRARMSELKSMLQNVPVPAGQPAGISAGAKVALGTFVAAVIATGAFLYLRNDEVQPVSDPKTEQSVAAPKEEGQTASATPEDKSEESPNAAEAQNETGKSGSGASDSRPTSPATGQKQKTVKPSQPVLDVFDPSKETATDEEATPADEAPRSTSATPGASVPVEVIRQHKSYDFHYQFRNERLYLYGPFEKNFYEIMEIFSDDKRTMFLYYKDGYYLLDEVDESIRPLKPIEDQELISRLKEYRSN